MQGIPPIPVSLAAKVAPYTEFRPYALASWHPARHELVVARRATNTAQLFEVRSPLGAPAQVTDFSEPVRWGAWWPAKPDALVFVRDAGGNEQSQLYRLDPGAKEPVPLTDPARQHQPLGINRARDRLLVGSTDVDKGGSRRENPTLDVALVDPLDPSSVRKVVTLPGTGWGDFGFSFDDRRLAMNEFKSVTETYVWVMDLATGERRRVLPAAGADPARTVASTEIQFSRDGRGLFLTTDRDGEFQRAAYLDLATGALEPFGPADRDVEQLALSRDGRTIAMVVNEAGVGVLRLYDADTRAELPRPQVPIGTVSGVQWHPDSTALAFELDSARSPGDVYVLDVAANRVARWTESKVEGLDASKFAVQTPIEWQSFDGRTITGFVARPDPGRFPGRRPVMIQIHGGPEGQARPGFLGRWNYYVNELGVAVIEPNVRGSTGYGKTFVSLDNGAKREDSVRDIGALLDWIAKQPDLDPSRVVVAGGSYGGYMANWAIGHTKVFRAAITDRCVSNLVSMQGTSDHMDVPDRYWRGAAWDRPETLWSQSPIAHMKGVTTPTLIIHSEGDLRCNVEQGEQVHAALAVQGVPCRFVRYPASTSHGMSRGGPPPLRIHRLHEMLSWLERWLAPARTAAAPRRTRGSRR